MEILRISWGFLLTFSHYTLPCLSCFPRTTAEVWRNPAARYQAANKDLDQRRKQNFKKWSKPCHKCFRAHCQLSETGACDTNTWTEDTLLLQPNAMTCHILPAHQPRGSLGTASLNHFALFNPMHKCVRAEAETSLCSVKAAVVLSWETEDTDPALMALEVTLQSHTLLWGPELGRPASGGMLRQARRPVPSPHREWPRMPGICSSRPRAQPALCSLPVLHPSVHSGASSA